MNVPAPRPVEVRTGTRLSVLEWGPADGEPFVLVHGLASNARLWDGVSRALAAAGRRVVAVDQRGHGRADKPDDGYDMATVADDLAGLIGALGLDSGPPPVVAGQSWGGNVVVELAHRHPDLVAAIACVDGGTIELGQRFPTFDECWTALAPPRTAGMAYEDLARRLRAMHRDWPETGIEGALACFERRPDGTAAPWLTRERHRLVLHGLWSHRPHQLFGSLTAPVLFIAADSGDEAWTAAKRDGIERALHQLGDGRAEWFSPADHDVHAQHPGPVAALLETLLPSRRGDGTPTTQGRPEGAPGRTT
jgi:pimeloyl-ACP methyl ester carboxylesterase